jgi:hypothetical protein
MDSYFFLAAWALLFASAVVVPAYVALLALVNVAYRLKSGRYFRWLSWRTVAPLTFVTVVGWFFFFRMLKGSPAGFVVKP